MWDLIVFSISAVIILIGGVQLTRIADRLADRTGLGEALMGGVVLGACTSISGSTLSVVSAYQEYTDLAISNAIGGITVQTFYLCIADMTYSKSNLEHAAASTTNIMLGLLLIVLLAIVLLIPVLPSYTLFGIHPMSVILLGVYFLGIKYVSMEKEEKMWWPKVTEKTVEDVPDEPKGGQQTLKSLWIQFIVLLAILIACGVSIEQSGVALAKSWGLSHSILGGVITAIITSLPELVITLTAVHRGAVTLAVGGIIGGNTFDILVLPFSDVAYRGGSLMHTMTDTHKAVTAITLLMTSVLLMGLIRREKFGIGRIGGESIAMTVLYLSSLIILFI